jgi:sec-independent protein translocase protein TatA
LHLDSPVQGVAWERYGREQLTYTCQLKADLFGISQLCGKWVFDVPGAARKPWDNGGTDRAAARPDGEKRMLNNIGLPGLLLIAVVVLVMFGKGKVSSLMGEVGKGITAFKRGVSDGTKEAEAAAQTEVAKDVTPIEKEKV